MEHPLVFEIQGPQLLPSTSTLSGCLPVPRTQATGGPNPKEQCVKQEIMVVCGEAALNSVQKPSKQKETSCKGEELCLRRTTSRPGHSEVSALCQQPETPAFPKTFRQFSLYPFARDLSQMTDAIRMYSVSYGTQVVGRRIIENTNNLKCLAP